MSHNGNKQRAAITMLDAFAASHRAYYLDDTPVNLKALTACREAVMTMLQPYYMEEGRSDE